MIRRYYSRSILAVLLIPAAAMLGGALFSAIDPEFARGHADYARNFMLLQYLRKAVLLATLLLMCALWTLACASLLRAKSRRWAWLWFAVLGPPGFAVLMALSDRSVPVSGDASAHRLARRRQILRVLYEVVRFVALGLVAEQLVEWWGYGTAFLEALNRGVALSVILAERDASSGMWAFGDSIRTGFVFVLLYALWPVGRGAAAAIIRRLRRGRTAVSG